MCSMRRPRGDIVVVFLLSVLAAVSPRTATASKPFTTELMVQNQDVGEVRFSTDGRWIYLEQLLPYRAQGYFDRERDWGRSLSVLSIVDVATGQTRMLRQSPQARTWYLGDSPDARSLAFGRLDCAVQRLGVLDQLTGQERSM